MQFTEQDGGEAAALPRLMTTTLPVSRRLPAQPRSAELLRGPHSLRLRAAQQRAPHPGATRDGEPAGWDQTPPPRPPPSTWSDPRSVLAIGPDLRKRHGPGAATAGAERAWGKREGDQPLGPPPALAEAEKPARHTPLTRTARGERPRPGHRQLSRRGSSAPGAAAGMRPGKRGDPTAQEAARGAAAGQSARETGRWGQATATGRLRKMRRDPYLLHS